MTARSVIRLLPEGAEVTGTVSFDGEDVYAMDGAALRAFRAERVGMIFQDPRAHVNPVRKLGDFLTEALIAHRGIAPDAARLKMLGILTDIGVSLPERRLEQYPHELSGGLLQRMMIAAVLAMEPELILADEPTTSLDVTTQSEVMSILDERRREAGLALVLITHDIELSAAVCDRTVVMYGGRTVEEGGRQLRASPQHPYTAALAASQPDLLGTFGSRLPTIGGRPLSAIEAPAGCPFATRCQFAVDACTQVEPVLKRRGEGSTACLRIEEIAPEIGASREHYGP